MEQFFYALIGICGLVVVLRAAVFAARIRHNEQPRDAGLAAGSTTTPWFQLENKPAPAKQLQSNGTTVHDDGQAKDPTPRGRLKRAASSFWRNLSSLPSFHENSLTGKMTIVFSAIIAIFGLLTIAAVYLTLTPSLKSHAGARASAAAVNISDRVSGFLLKRDIAGLRGFLRRSASQAGIAYVLVENQAGEIVAYSFAPEEVKQGSLQGAMPADSPRISEVGQPAVQEVTAPVLNGSGGAVRLGLWHDDFHAEVSRTVAQLIKLILLVMGGGIILASFLAWKIGRPIGNLVKAAQSISTGDVAAPGLDVEDSSEFGELSRAFERLRSSVNAAMTRLNLER